MLLDCRKQEPLPIATSRRAASLYPPVLPTDLLELK
jgi:hypothetical protein